LPLPAPVQRGAADAGAPGQGGGPRDRPHEGPAALPDPGVPHAGRGGQRALHRSRARPLPALPEAAPGPRAARPGRPEDPLVAALTRPGAAAPEIAPDLTR